jgi:hypothetical protein
MSGRRSYSRFNLNPSSHGVLRTLRDVTVQRLPDDELVVMGREPAIVGDIMTLDIVDGDAGPDQRVRVLESVPVVVDGSVRHRLRVRRLSPPNSSRSRSEQDHEIGRL